MANSFPTLSNFISTITFDENTVNATPQFIDTNVAFDDADDNFDTGTLQLSGLLAEDIVSIFDQGMAMGQIGFDGATVTFGGTTIGTATGGTGGTPFVVTLNASATAASIDALIQNLTYANLSDEPTASRTLELTITDAAGAVARPAFEFDAPESFVGIPAFTNPAANFVDLDGDGDLDVIVGGLDGMLRYGENTGTAVAASYVTRTGMANPFDGFDIGDESTPSFGDLDGDGDLDLVVGELAGGLNYFENTGSATAPSFIARVGGANPFDGLAAFAGSAPALVDLDGDGDLDAALGTMAGLTLYYENTGTSVAADYILRALLANPFDGISVGADSKPSFADLDRDGDFDLIIGQSDGTLDYFENTGTALAPDFVASTTTISVDLGDNTAPIFADIDGDGDLDLSVGTLPGGQAFHENTTVGFDAAFVEVTGAANPFNSIDVGFYSKPTFADLDGDGDLDVAIGEDGNTVNYYENTGSAIAPVYVEQVGMANPFGGLSFYKGTPSFADLDGDGDFDAVIGTYFSSISYYENTGSSVAPSFSAGMLNGLSAGLGVAPSFADLDGDGDLDAVIGGSDGNLDYFENTGSSVAASFVARTGAANPLDGFDVGIASAANFADFDGDGDLDAVVGESGGTLAYFQNTGTGIAPSFVERTGAANPFDGVDVGLGSAPSFADIDGDGDVDAVIGDQLGMLNYFENTGAGLSFVLNVTPQGETLVGTPGADVLVGGSQADDIDGRGGNDLLFGGGGNDFIFGGAGNDDLRGQGGNDELRGANGNDVAYGADGDDLILGQGGDDDLRGNAGDDDLRGAIGNDRLDGGLDDDVLYGQAGNDRLIGNNGDDRLIGGAGFDIAIFSGNEARYDVVTFANGTVQITDTLGNNGSDRLIGVERAIFDDGFLNL